MRGQAERWIGMRTALLRSHGRLELTSDDAARDFMQALYGPVGAEVL
jgi:hypothetical protein